MDNNRVIVRPASDGCVQGTVVMVGDVRIPRVTRVTLVADPENGRWRATIECDAYVDGDIVATLAKAIVPDKPDSAYVYAAREPGAFAERAISFARVHSPLCICVECITAVSDAMAAIPAADVEAGIRELYALAGRPTCSCDYGQTCPTCAFYDAKATAPTPPTAPTHGLSCSCDACVTPKAPDGARS